MSIYQSPAVKQKGQIIIFKKLELANVWHLYLKNDWAINLGIGLDSDVTYTRLNVTGIILMNKISKVSHVVWSSKTKSGGVNLITITQKNEYFTNTFLRASSSALRKMCPFPLKHYTRNRISYLQFPWVNLSISILPFSVCLTHWGGRGASRNLLRRTASSSGSKQLSSASWDDI